MAEHKRRVHKHPTAHERRPLRGRAHKAFISFIKYIYHTHTHTHICRRPGGLRGAMRREASHLALTHTHTHIDVCRRLREVRPRNRRFLEIEMLFYKNQCCITNNDIIVLTKHSQNSLLKCLLLLLLLLSLRLLASSR